MKRYGLTAMALIMLAAEIVDDTLGLSSLRGKKGAYEFEKKLNMNRYQLKSAIQSLEKSGDVKKVGDNLLITPKGVKKARKLKMFAPINRLLKKDWDQKWRIVIFDIPERMRSQRNIFRAILKRKGFVKIQNSVFACPQANINELNEIRHELKIEKYVNVLIAISAETDDDRLLKDIFFPK